MKQKTKTFLLVVALTFVMSAPVLSARADGLNVCGDPNEEAAAVQQLYNLRLENFNYDQQKYNDALKAALNNFRDKTCKLSDIFRQIARLTNFLIGAVGIFAVFRLVSSSFDMVISYGNENKIKAAKEAMSNAIIGVVLVLSAFAVINTLFYFFQVRVNGSSTISFPFNPFAK